MDNELLEILQGFVSEGHGLLDDAEAILLGLQGTLDKGVEPDKIDALFRCFHSLKGGAAALSLTNISKATHAAETLLDKVRKNEKTLKADHLTLFFRLIDFVRECLDAAETRASDNGFESASLELSNAFEATLNEEATPPKDQNLVESLITPELVGKFVQEASESMDEIEQLLLALTQSGEISEDELKTIFQHMHSSKGNAGFMGLMDLQTVFHMSEDLLAQAREGLIKLGSEHGEFLLLVVDSVRKALQDLSQGGKGKIPDLPALNKSLSALLRNKETPQKQEKPAPDSSPKTGASKPNQPVKHDIRVGVDKVDAIVNLVGELVIAESMVTRCPAVMGIDDSHYLRAVDQLRRVSSDLQYVAMSMRMIPLSTTFRKMVRLVHDLSNTMDKATRVVLLGEETEVDKTVAELIADPLVHIIRNAVDHGIESKEERVASGKPETGTITIEAKHEGGEVWVTIKDDGRGLNKEKIFQKALEKGMVTGSPSDYSDQKIFNLIFEAGFSTAEKVTDVSGRGVGMDVVRKNVSQMRGRIDLASRPGLGTTVTLRIPLTLAVIDAMLIRVSESVYTIPIFVIKELFKIKRDSFIVTSEGQEVIRIRESVLPVVRLHQIFRLKEENSQSPEVLLIVVDTPTGEVCMLVDEVVGQQSVVIKGLPDYLKGSSGLAGCTILGDGTVSLILDVGSIVQKTTCGDIRQ